MLKSGAGIWGIPGYAMKGVHREFLKLGSRSKDLTGYIETSRAVQGVHELNENEELRPYIVQRWCEIRPSSPRAQASGWQTRRRARRHSGGGEDERRRRPGAMVDMRTYVDDQSMDDDGALHRAIRASTLSTSSPPAWARPAGAPTSPQELDSSSEKLSVVVSPPTAGSSTSDTAVDDPLRRAIRPSVSRHGGPPAPVPERDPELEEAIRLSMMEASITRSRSFDVLRRKPVPPPRQPEVAATSIAASSTSGGIYDGELIRRIDSGAVPSRPPSNYSNPGGELDDEFDAADLRRAIEESRLEHQHLQQRALSPSPPPPPSPSPPPPCTQAQDAGVVDDGVDDDVDDAELARALQESLRLEEENRRKREEEERTVLEYVARFSREEAEREREREMRQRLAK